MQILNDLEHAREKFVATRNRYVSEIKKARKDFWQKFVNLEANKDPWGIPYKIVRDKIRKAEVITSLTKEDGSVTESLDETMQALLSKCVPWTIRMMKQMNKRKSGVELPTTITLMSRGILNWRKLERQLKNSKTSLPLGQTTLTRK